MISMKPINWMQTTHGSFYVWRVAGIAAVSVCLEEYDNPEMLQCAYEFCTCPLQCTERKALFVTFNRIRLCTHNHYNTMYQNVSPGQIRNDLTNLLM